MTGFPPGACGRGLADAYEPVVHQHPNDERVAPGLGGVQGAFGLPHRDADAPPFQSADAHSAPHYAGAGGEEASGGEGVGLDNRRASGMLGVATERLG